MKRAWLALCLLASAPAFADDIPAAPATVNLTGSRRTGYWSSNRDLDRTQNYTPSSLWLKAAPSLGGGWFARGEGWVLDERPLVDGGRPRAELREGYVGWHDDRWEFTAGRRIVAWGRADRINPTDVVTTRDYTRLFAEDDDQRRGSLMMTASYAFDDLVATAFWLPEFRTNIFPVPKVAGLTVRQGADRLQAKQFALRLDQNRGNFDWAVSYLNGINRNPGASLIAVSPSNVIVNAVYNDVQVLGADFTTNLGGYGVRGEIAYSQPGASRANVFNPRPYVEAVLGADRNLTSGLNVNVQYMVRQLLAYSNPAGISDPVASFVAVKAAQLNNQRRRVQHGPALRVAYTTLNEALLLELTGLVFVTDRSFSVRPRATYAINDNVKLVVGGDVFVGRSDSYFGQLSQNTTFLSELRFGF